MFDEKIQQLIQKEVSQAVSEIITNKGLEAIVSETIEKMLEPVVRMQIIGNKKRLTEKEAGELYSISPATLKTWRSRGLPAPRYSKIGDRIVYSIEDLEAFFNKKKEKRLI